MTRPPRRAIPTGDDNFPCDLQNSTDKFMACVIKALNTQERRSWLGHEKEGKPFRVNNVFSLTEKGIWIGSADRR